MTRLVMSLVGIAAKTILGFLSIWIGIWGLGIFVQGMAWQSHNAPDGEFFVLGGLTCLLLWFAYFLGGAAWRLVN
jgi:hypothetical protein